MHSNAKQTLASTSVNFSLTRSQTMRKRILGFLSPWMRALNGLSQEGSQQWILHNHRCPQWWSMGSKDTKLPPELEVNLRTFLIGLKKNQNTVILWKTAYQSVETPKPLRTFKLTFHFLQVGKAQTRYFHIYMKPAYSLPQGALLNTHLLIRKRKFLRNLPSSK